jgi:hypothetical protein
MATQKTYTVVIEERKLQSTAPDEALTQLEESFKRRVAEFNTTNAQADLWVVSVQEQQ